MIFFLRLTIVYSVQLLFILEIREEEPVDHGLHSQLPDGNLLISSLRWGRMYFSALTLTSLSLMMILWRLISFIISLTFEN